MTEKSFVLLIVYNIVLYMNYETMISLAIKDLLINNLYEKERT